MTALPIVDNHGPPAEREPGALEAALAELWPRVRKRVYAPGYLWATLKLRRRFALRFIHVGELKVSIPMGQVPDCESCEEICCTGPNAIVSLRLKDIAALVDAGLERFIVHERAPAPAQRAATWARREADDSVFHRVFPVLQRDATGTCALLTDERMCGAYPAWPLSCARYPYALDLQSRVVFWAKGCRSMKTVEAHEAPLRIRALLRGVVDGYNERVKDAVLLHVARPEIEELGLARFLRLDEL